MANNTKTYTPVERFFMLLKPDKSEIYNVYIYAVFSGLVALSLPLGIQAIINLIQGGQMSTSFVVLIVIVVGGIIASGILNIFQLYITENLQQKIFARAAIEFAFRIPRIKTEVLYKHYPPELINRFFDIVGVQKGLSKVLIDFSSAALQVIFGLILLSIYHPFFVVFSLILMVLVYIIFKFTASRGLSSSLQESKYKYEVAHWLEEIARNNETFKVSGKTNLPIERADAHVSNYIKARESHFKVLVQQYSLLVIFKAIVALGLLAVGGILVMEQSMNIGQFVAAEIIIILLIGSVEKLIMSLETIYDVLTSVEKIGQFTDLELEPLEGINLEEECKEGGLKVELNNVEFQYPEYHESTIKNLSLDINCGEKYVITGSNGSGKSTLLQLLAGLYKNQGGNISYNELPAGSISADSLREVIGYCRSQEDLFMGTLMENITMGRKKGTFENVKWAVKNLGLSNYIKSLPHGYETIIDPQGKKLPRSIIHKIVLARSIATIPKLLLLEDVFEHIDENQCKDIIDFLTSEENKWTIVAVSSVAYFAQKSDRVVYLKDGSVERISKHRE